MMDVDRDGLQDQRIADLERSLNELTIEVRSIVKAIDGVATLMKGLAGIIVAAIGGTAVL
jgi:hypothetical protein